MGLPFSLLFAPAGGVIREEKERRIRGRCFPDPPSPLSLPRSTSDASEIADRALHRRSACLLFFASVGPRGFRFKDRRIGLWRPSLVLWRSVFGLLLCGSLWLPEPWVFLAGVRFRVEGEKGGCYLISNRGYRD
ncbi:hypothetical protein BHM03_00027048 [Ensete ventricosum]|nr:hypothetical protein BHM03_00027048 [Ensete ventricosum]